MNLTGQQVITRALRLARVLGFDEAPDPFTLNEGLLQLQLLLDRWKQDNHLHYPPDHPLPTFTALAGAVDVPDGVAEFMIGALASLIASENGQTIDQSIARATQAGLDLRRIKLADLQIPPIEHNTLGFGSGCGLGTVVASNIYSG